MLNGGAAAMLLVLLGTVGVITWLAVVAGLAMVIGRAARVGELKARQAAHARTRRPALPA